MKKTKKRLLILGADDYARALGLYLLDDDSQYIVEAFVDDANKGKTILDIPVIGSNDIPDTKYEVVTIAADFTQTHNIIRKVTKYIPDLFERIIQSPLYNDTRVATLYLLREEIYRRNISGCVAELGVYKGQFASHINTLFSDRDLYLFDTFSGFDERDTVIENVNGYSDAQKEWFDDTDVSVVAEKMKYIDHVKFVKGYFPDSLKNRADINEKFAFVSLDADLYQPIYEGLKYFYPRLEKGGYIMIHDYNCNDFLGVKKAVDDYSQIEDICIVPVFDFGGSVIITK